jgi:beta-lactamase regulating signal transducer with metallopeptidase domain
MITFFSFMMSVIFSSLFMIIVHMLRKKKKFIISFGASTVITAYLVCIGRMILPVETGITKVIAIPKVYNRFFEIVYLNKIRVGTTDINLFGIFLLIWLLGAIIATAYLLINYIDKRSKVLSNSYSDEKSKLILHKITQEKGFDSDICIMRCNRISIPMGMGLIKKLIILPDYEYSQDELIFILKHELTHFINHDFIIKFVTRIFCCAFWWNPLVYMYGNDIDQMLEIKCDLSVTENLNNSEKTDYLKVIVDSLRKSTEIRLKSIPIVSTQLHKECRYSMVERFELIRDYKRPNLLKYRIMLIACMLCLFCASYLVIFQSSYEVPQSEMTEGAEYGSFTSNDGYILRDSKGNYSLILEDGTSQTLTEEEAKLFESTGIEIKEE